MPIAPAFRLSTPIVVLRRLDLDDLAPLHESVMADAEVMRFIGTGQTSTRAEVQAFLERIISRYDESDLGWFAVAANTESPSAVGLPEFCGVACLKPFAGELLQAFGEHIEVGYWLAKAAWGRGVATAAATALVRRGFRDLNLPEIVGVAHADNHASNRVLQKAGLRHVRSINVCNWPLEFYSRTHTDYPAE